MKSHNTIYFREYSSENIEYNGTSNPEILGTLNAGIHWIRLIAVAWLHLGEDAEQARWVEPSGLIRLGT